MINLNNNSIKSGNEEKSSTIGVLISLILFSLVIILYIGSIKFTLTQNDGMFSYRSTLWMDYAIGICSLIVIVIRLKKIDLLTAVYGLCFAFLCFISYIYQMKVIRISMIYGFITFLAYLAGSSMKDKECGVISSVNEGNVKNTIKSILFGIAVSIPFACINIAYFTITQGSIRFNSLITSGYLSLFPSIGEEIVYRFFIINAIIKILKNRLSRKHLIFVVFFFAIVPHTIVHFSDLWLNNIPSAIFMLLSLGLVFGLPMAYLQYKLNLESAIGFHWFIDFLRFFLGF